MGGKRTSRKQAHRQDSSGLWGELWRDFPAGQSSESILNGSFRPVIRKESTANTQTALVSHRNQEKKQGEGLEVALRVAYPRGGQLHVRAKWEVNRDGQGKGDHFTTVK